MLPPLPLEQPRTLPVRLGRRQSIPAGHKKTAPPTPIWTDGEGNLQKSSLTLKSDGKWVHSDRAAFVVTHTNARLQLAAATAVLLAVTLPVSISISIGF